MAFLGLVVASLVVPAAAPPAAAGDGTAELDPAVESFLRAPGPALAAVPGGFRIIALSNVAQYCANVAVAEPALRPAGRRCLGRTAEVALGRLSPYGGGLDARSAPLGGHGLYLSHLNIVLGAYRRAVGDGRYDAVQARISRHLAARSLGDPTFHAASYPGVRPRWPADQAATLYSLDLYDRLSGEHLSVEPIERWLAFIQRRGTSAVAGLPVSDVAGVTPTSGLPRGCALSFTVRYLAAFAPDAARLLWDRYREAFGVNLGAAAGFREWPEGVERPADVDSGPIVLGVGAAATGLGLAASRAVGDELTYLQLRGSELLVRTFGGDAARAGDTLLARAISLAAATHVAWF